MEPKRPFASRAGWLALWLAWAAVILFLVQLLTKPWRETMPEAYGLALVTLSSLGVFLCLIVSVPCGLLALVGIRKHGRKGILAPAVAGLGIATLMLIPVLLSMGSGLAGASGSSPVKARAAVTNQNTSSGPIR